MQKLESGPLCDLLPPESSLWLDGGHNPAAARVIADTLRELAHGDNPVLMVLGILANKDVAGFLKPFAGLLTAVYSVPVPKPAHPSPEEISAICKNKEIAAITYHAVSVALMWKSHHAERAKHQLTKEQKAGREK